MLPGRSLLSQKTNLICFLKDTTQVSRRYTDFALLQSALQDSGVTPNLPKKKMVGNLGEYQHIVRRINDLQASKSLSTVFSLRQGVHHKAAEGAPGVPDGDPGAS